MRRFMSGTLDDYLATKIAKKKALIDAYENAAEKIALGTMQSYTFDTGQTNQQVTKINLIKLTDAIDALYNQLVTLEARLTGCGVVIVRPAW